METGSCAARSPWSFFLRRSRSRAATRHAYARPLRFPRVRLRTTVSIRKEPLPPPGVRHRAWAWDDVLASPPPSESRRDEPGRIVLRHGFDEDPDADSRVGYATLVDAREGEATVDERLVVEPRVLAPALKAERFVSRQLERGSDLGVRVVNRTTDAVSSRIPGRTGVAVRRGGGYVAQGLAWVSKTIRDGLRAVVEAPDRLYSGGASAGAHLRAKGERRLFLRGLLDPQRLTAEGKAAALVLAVGVLAALALTVTFVVALGWPAAAGVWRAGLSFFLLGLGSTLLFPFFPELAFSGVAAQTGPIAAILAVALGMSVGGWMVLFLGDAANNALRRSVSPDSQVARFLDRTESIAARHGFLLAVLILAIPYGPDTPVFYVLASVRTPTASYVAGTLLGTLARFTILEYVILSGALAEGWSRLVEGASAAWPW